MADLLDLPEQAEDTQRGDPWAFARRQYPDSDVVRVINRTEGKQYFVQIPRPRKATDLKHGYELLASDGSTYITPALKGTDLERAIERDRIIAEADAAWPANLR